MSVVLTQRDGDAALVRARARLRAAARQMMRVPGDSIGTRTPFLATALIAMASTSGRRAALVTDGVTLFLLALVVLLALAVVAIIRLRPPERPSSSDDDASQLAEPQLDVARLRMPGPAPRLVAPVVSPRGSGRHDNRGYAPRHVPRSYAETNLAERPQVSGGPPWDPAPRPPDLG